LRLRGVGDDTHAIRRVGHHGVDMRARIFQPTSSRLLKKSDLGGKTENKPESKRVLTRIKPRRK
jgi:hypothetical protein